MSAAAGATYSTSPIPFQQPAQTSMQQLQQTPTPVSSQIAYTSPPVVIASQVMTSQVTTSPVVTTLAPTQSETVAAASTSSSIRSQRSVPTNLQGFEGYPNNSGQTGSGVQSPSGVQLPANPHHTYSGAPSNPAVHPTISQQSFVAAQQPLQQQSPLQQQQFQPHQIPQSQYQQSQFQPPQSVQQSMPVQPIQQQQQPVMQPQPTSISMIATSQHQASPIQTSVVPPATVIQQTPVVIQQPVVQQPVSIAAAAPSSVSLPASMTPGVPSSVSMAVPSSISMAVPSSVSMAIPSSVSMAVPSSVSMAIPSSVSMAIPSSVSMGMPMSSVDPMYIVSSGAAPTLTTTMSRHVSVVQPPMPQTSYLAASSPQVLPTSNLSAVNSIPPSRDPIAGGLTPAATNLTPTVTVRETYVPPFKDSQPIAGDLLVERLEEISTQRDLADDPER